MLDKRKFYIDGKWINPDIKNDFEVINPSNEESYAIISLGSKKDVDLGVKAAKNAFLNWSQINKKIKIDLLENLLNIYKSRWDEITETMSNEMGAPLDWSSSPLVISPFDFSFRKPININCSTALSLANKIPFSLPNL